MNSLKITLGSVLYTFFEDYLQTQKALREETIKSYRDVLTLFLLFTANKMHRRITQLSILDLTAKQVLEFLNHLEIERDNHIRTRNHRLSALKVFFDYLVTQMPEAMLEAQRVAAIPLKRTKPAEVGYLLPEQISELFSCMPKTGRFALRDRTLLLLLYNTGARVQEVAELCVENLQLDSPSRVHLHGKGDKWRVCPLWQETVTLLRRQLVERGNVNAKSPVFLSLQGAALTRFGIYKLVRRHTKHLLASNQKTVSPHTFRHAAAVHLLESGVDVNVIRAWLGHVSLETTNRYAEISLRMKAEALKICEPKIPGGENPLKEPCWRKDQALLKWLQSL
jgi:integrase/recombinase XerD